MGKICGQQPGAWRSAAKRNFGGERQRQIAGPAAEIEHTGIGIGKHVAEQASDPASPQHIVAQRKKMVEEVITRRDAAEHFAHLSRCSGLVRGARRPGSGQGHAALFGRWHRGAWAHFALAPFLSKSASTRETSLSGISPIVSALPILRVSTKRNFPPRVFLSA